MILHGYWRSGAAYRVRIALALKGITYEQVGHDLRKSEQTAPEYAALNPLRLVPALEVDDVVLTQSVAIIEWLEDSYPTPPLLPEDATGRALARALVATIASDIHPLHNLRIGKALRAMGQDDAGIAAWNARWFGDGFAAVDMMIARHGAGFAVGGAPTIADCFTVPALYSAERFGIDLAPYPHLVAAGANAAALPAIQAAHPSAQPDADPE